MDETINRVADKEEFPPGGFLDETGICPTRNSELPFKNFSALFIISHTKIVTTRCQGLCKGVESREDMQRGDFLSCLPYIGQVAKKIRKNIFPQLNCKHSGDPVLGGGDRNSALAGKTTIEQ